jgi:hypothetical protein
VKTIRSPVARQDAAVRENLLPRLNFAPNLIQEGHKRLPGFRLLDAAKLLDFNRERNVKVHPACCRIGAVGFVGGFVVQFHIQENLLELCPVTQSWYLAEEFAARILVGSVDATPVSATQRSR